MIKDGHTLSPSNLCNQSLSVLSFVRALAQVRPQRKNNRVGSPNLVSGIFGRENQIPN